jgi:hypothetical protein
MPISVEMFRSTNIRRLQNNEFFSITICSVVLQGKRRLFGGTKDIDLAIICTPNLKMTYTRTVAPFINHCHTFSTSSTILTVLEVM